MKFSKSRYRKKCACLCALLLMAFAPWGASAGLNHDVVAQQKAPVKNDPSALVEIRPEQFGGVDVCLRDTSGEENICSHEYGIIKEEGGQPERICKVSGRALEGIKKARASLKKIDPNLEILVVSSYRYPGYQQCLWAKKTNGGYHCNSAVCGAKDPKTHSSLACKQYNLKDPKYAHVFDHCPHVNRETVDACAYDRTKVKINERNQLDMTVLEDCRKASNPNHKLAEGFYYHPCTCRFTSWTNDMRNGSKRSKIFTHGGPEDQQAMIKAMRSTGWSDNAPSEWWHFKYKSE